MWKASASSPRVLHSKQLYVYIYITYYLMYTLVQENLHVLQAEQQIGKIYKYVKVICNVISIVETIRKIKNEK